MCEAARDARFVARRIVNELLADPKTGLRHCLRPRRKFWLAIPPANLTSFSNRFMTQPVSSKNGHASASSHGIEFRVEGVHKAFGDNQVLRGIDLEIANGDVIAIVGGSGSGKTVLLNTMLGLLAPDSGRVFVADHAEAGGALVDLNGLSAEELDRLHSHWGVVFQRNALFSGNVFENIALWLREVRDLENADIQPLARSVLEAVDLPSDDAFLHTATGSLSGGMAKRLAVARALAMDPVVIFYDEPTSGLDPISASHIQDLIQSAHSDRGRGRPTRTSVIVTHDKDLLSRLEPRVVMLHEGRILFDGPFAEFHASDSPVIRPYFELMPTYHLRGAAG